MQAAKRRRPALANRLRHLRDEREVQSDAFGIRAWLELSGQIFAERRGSISRQQLADLGEFQQFEGVGIHRSF